jgi:hypothetical protein
MATTKKPPQGEDVKMPAPQVKRPEPQEIPEEVAPPAAQEPIPVVLEPASTRLDHSATYTGYNALNDDEARRVAMIKEKFGDITVYLKNLRESYHDGEVQRALSVAITEAETASMWAVKAVTWRG